MKQLLVILFLLLCTNNLCAQDVIVKKDGDIIRSKVLEVTPSGIKYKKQSNPNGPTYTINISDVLSVNYENGEKESYGTAQPEATNTPQYIVKPTDERNAVIIQSLSKCYIPSKKIKRTANIAKRCLIIVGVDESSMMSNEDIEMTLEGFKKQHYSGYGSFICYGIKITNKTNKFIYVDKGKCFRKSSDEPWYCYSNSSGAEQILQIPPYASQYLTNEKWDDKTLIEAMERFRFKHVSSKDIGLHKGCVRCGQTLTFNQEDLPWNREYIISYYMDDPRSNINAIPTLLGIKLYIHQVIGCRHIELQSVSEEGTLSYEDYVQDFDSNTIIGYHKFDADEEIYPSSYETIGRKGNQQEQIANAIMGATISTMGLFLPKQQSGVPVYNRNSGTSISGGSTGYGASSYSSSSSSSSSRSSSNSKGSVCRNCNGGGKCPSCHGKGIRTDNSFGTGTDPTKKCGVCGGDGICNTCGGSGHKN